MPLKTQKANFEIFYWYISNTIEHIEIIEEKDLVHIEKVSDDTFTSLKLSRFSGLSYVFLVFPFVLKTTVNYMVKDISIIIIC